MTMVEDSLTIGEVARVAGVPTSTIRYYERRGILPRAPRVAGQREYTAGALRYLAAIRIAKEAGFSLTEIKEMARSIGDSRQPSKLWTEVASDKLDELDALIERAEGMRESLQHGLGCGCRSLRGLPIGEGPDRGRVGERAIEDRLCSFQRPRFGEPAAQGGEARGVLAFADSDSDSVDAGWTNGAIDPPVIALVAPRVDPSHRTPPYRQQAELEVGRASRASIRCQGRQAVLTWRSSMTLGIAPSSGQPW